MDPIEEIIAKLLAKGLKRERKWLAVERELRRRDHLQKITLPKLKFLDEPVAA